jgi:enoyl-CoA hydratase
MAYETLIVEKEDGVGIIKLNRPPVNPLNTQMYLDLFDAVSELDADPAIGAIIITGGGDKAFAAGLDIKDVMGKAVVDILDFCWKGPRKAFDKLTGIEKPTIAAVSDLLSAADAKWPCVVISESLRKLPHLAFRKSPLESCRGPAEHRGSRD